MIESVRKISSLEGVSLDVGEKDEALLPQRDT